jgi:hypothetical protein
MEATAPSKLQQAMQASLDREAAPLASNDGQRLIEAGDKLLRSQQARLIAVQAEHERSRTERINYYRGEMQRLSDEAEHELLLMDRQLAGTVSKIVAMITKLKAMRGA